jgi:hypothetical protein
LDGAAFRRAPGQRYPTRYPHRLPDGTQVRIWSNVIMGSDGLQWRNVSLLNLPPVINGYVADQYLEPMFGPPPSPPGPGPSSAPEWGLVFNRVGYKKGWGLAQHPATDPGIDLVSAIDTANPSADASGISSNEACDSRTETDPNKLAARGRSVYAVAGGTVVWSGPDGTPADCFGGDCPNQKEGAGIQIKSMLGDTFLINYHHLVLAPNLGGTVTAGQPLGYYTQRGQSSVPHLHIRVRKNGTDMDPY